jgi:hypothetical protein
VLLVEIVDVTETSHVDNMVDDDVSTYSRVQLGPYGLFEMKEAGILKKWTICI